MQSNPNSQALLNADFSAAVTPVITLAAASGATQTVASSPQNGNNGFSVNLDLALPYGPLNGVLQNILRGKRIQLTEGFINQHAVLEGCKVYSNFQNSLEAEVPFSGSYSGTFYLTGTPFYNPQFKRIELQNVAYDLKTSSLILKGAKWLFGNVILNEIKKYTAIDLTTLYAAATKQLEGILNKQWTTGVSANGTVAELFLTNVAAQKDQLLIQAQCRGDLTLTLSELALKF